MTKNYNDELAKLSRGIARQNQINDYIADLQAKIATLEAISIQSVANAMNEVQLRYGHSDFGKWVNNRKINSIIDNAVALGWVWRGSHTQVKWTDAGLAKCKEYENESVKR